MTSATEFLNATGLLPFGIKTGCQWPLGKTASGIQTFCDETRAFPKSPYCQAHRDMAYKPVITEERTEQ